MIPTEWATDAFLLICCCVGAVGLLIFGGILWYFEDDSCF